MNITRYGKLTKKSFLYTLLPVILIFILFSQVFTLKGAFIAHYGDILQLTMPYHFFADHPGALWNNMWITGFPDYAGPISDLYYPFSFPFYFIFRDITVINFILLLHLIIAYFAFHKLGTLLTENENVLLLFSLSYVFSGAVLGRLGQTVILFALAWIPFIYFYFFKMALYRDLKVKNIVLFAISSTFLVFSGMMYYVVFVAMVLGIFFISAVWQKTIDKRAALSIMVSIILTGFLSAIKWIPSLLISPFLLRIDPIDPLSGGGLLELNLSSFLFGTAINSRYMITESLVLLGVVICIFALMGLAKGSRKIAIPGFLTIVLAFIWADGGNTLLSFIHYLPGMDTFRCPGRIFAAAVPIVILLSMEGFLIATAVFRDSKAIILNEETKRHLWIGIIIIAAVKILELPFQTVPPVEAIAAVAIVVSFIIILYLGKVTMTTLVSFISGALLLEILLLIRNFQLFAPVSLGKIALMAAIVFTFIIFSSKERSGTFRKNPLCVLLLIGVFISTWGCSGFLADSDPRLEESAGKIVADKIVKMSENNRQIWVLDTGWPYQHIDFTYWYIQKGLHPIRAYYAYFLKDMPALAYKIGNESYFTADWIVDTAALEGSPTDIAGSPIMVENVPLYKMSSVLPNALVIRNGEIINSTISEYSPDRVILSGTFQPGDTALLKMAYYRGWKINGLDARPGGNMVAATLLQEGDKIEFRFDPLDYRVGQVFTIIGILIIFCLYLKRRSIDEYFSITPSSKSQKRVKLKTPQS